MTSSSANVRFFSKLDKDSSPIGCWIFQGRTQKTGECTFSIGYKSTQAHRYAYQFFFGDIPNGSFVLHKCGDKRCCNPDHLFLGGKQDTFPNRRFIEQIDIPDDPTSCWLWKGATHKFGYGVFSIKRNNFSAHRYSYTLFNGPIPDGLFVCHSCDNPGCVNPDHLWIGTQKDNMRDKLNKGRHIAGRTASSEYLDSIMDIVMEVYDCGLSLAETAKMFNVQYSTMQRRILKARQARGDIIDKTGRRC